MKRRTVLAAGAAAALAGCSDDGSDDGDEGGDDADDTPEGGNSTAEGGNDIGNSTTIGGGGNETANETRNESPEATENESDGPAEYELVVLVIDAEGEPIEGATVAVAEDGEPIAAFDGADRATTDGSGAVEATLPEGSYQAGAIVDDRQTVEDVELSGDDRVILRIEPTEEERAAEAIDRAQSELSAAVTELNEQSGDTLDATDELSTRPIADRLAAARIAVSDAREFATDDQEATLSAIESAVAFVRAVLDGQPWLHGVARSIDRLMEALRKGEDDRATYVAEDVARELEGGRDRIGAIEERAGVLEGEVEPVEAIDWPWVDDRRSSLVADYRAAGEIAEAVPALLSAEERFGEGREVFERGAYVTARSSFETTQGAFEDVRTGFEPPESSAFAGAIAAIDCTAAAMATAADRYYWAADAARSGDEDREEEYVEAAEEALAEAGDCGLRPIGPDALLLPHGSMNP